MSIDSYTLCPCGSNKKIKFCCGKEIAAELDRLQRMLKGDQKLAAKQKVEDLLKAHPDHPALLAFQAQLALGTDDLETAKRTVARMLAIDPNNQMAYAYQVIITLMEKGPLEAIEKLQDLLERFHELGQRSYEALLLVGQSLIQTHPMAARGHLQLAVSLTGAEEKSAVQLLLGLNRAEAVPLVLREPVVLKMPPQQVTWRIEFEHAMQPLGRGAWRRAASALEDMSYRVLDEPAILWNLGVFRAWLAQNDKAAEAFRSFAKIRQLPFDDRVHAEALAQLLLPKQPKTAQVELEYELTDVERAMELLLSDDHFVPQNEATFADLDPRPKAHMVMLNQPKPKWDPGDEPLAANELPIVIAVVRVYGKQTTRPARLVLIALEPLDRPVAEALLKDRLGELLKPEPLGTVRTPVPHHRLLHIGVYLPDHLTDYDLVNRLDREGRVLNALSRWRELPCPYADDLPPEEAVKEGKWHVPLSADLTIVELETEHAPFWDRFDQLRQEIGLPMPTPVDGTAVELETIPPHRLHRLLVDKISDEKLLVAYRRAYAVNFRAALRRILPEILSREPLHEKVDMVEVYDLMSELSVSTDDALKYLEKARKLATTTGESPAQWLIDEAAIRLRRGEVDRFVALLHEIQSRYIKEPGVPQLLLQMLSEFGLVTPDGRIMIPTMPGAGASPASPVVAATAPTGATEPPGGVWTPDAPAASEPSGEGKSKLWIPGQD